MREIVLLVLDDPVAGVIAAVIALGVYVAVFAVVDGSRRNAPGAQRITGLSPVPRGFAYGTIGALALSAGALFIYAQAAFPGTLKAVYRVDDRFAALYERPTRRGPPMCTLRVVDADSGRLAGLTSHQTDCVPHRPHGNRAWLTTPQRFETMHSKEWFAVDLYRGATTADAAAVLEQHGSARRAGDHRFLEVEHGSSVKAQLQDGSVVWVSSDGAVRPAASPAAPPTAERLTLHATPATRRGLHRVKRLETDCGCREEDCGELVLFSSAAFGEGTNHIGLWKDDRLEWQQALDRWSIDEALAVAKHADSCSLFGRNTVVLPVLGLYGSGTAVVFDRASGQRTHELAL